MGLPRLSAALGAWLLLSAFDMAAPPGALLATRPSAKGTTAPPPVFGAADRVLTHDSARGAFRIHYTTQGQHAVPSLDADADGVPDYVRSTADEYDRVLDFFVSELGFQPPRDDAQIEDDHGGDGRFDVYLLDFPTSADGAYRSEACTMTPPRRCAGYMLQENDFDRRNYPSLAVATRILASHELFHAVQAAHLASASVVLGEGSAVWASEAYDETLTDFEGFIGGYLARPDRSLGQEPTGPVDPFSYGAALFFRFLEETRDRQMVRALWETLPAFGSWPEALDAVLRRRADDDSLTRAFATFAYFNLQTGRRAAAGRGYRDAARYPEVSEKAVSLPFSDPLVRMAPLSARYFVSTVAMTGELAARLVGLTHDTDELVLLLAVERAGQLLEIPQDPLSSARASVHAEAGDRVHMLVIDSRVTGPIRRIALCIGTPERATAGCTP